MNVDGWKYYNHAAIPTTAPHENVNMIPVDSGVIWKIPGKPLLARWTTDWDCDSVTKWWYVIKDSPFEISVLKSKRRYEINKGVKTFSVVEINCSDYKEAIYQVQVAAMQGYPEDVRSEVDKERLYYNIDNKWDYYKSYGAFHRETGELCGYSLLRKDGVYINFALQYAKPEYEKYGLNAALVYQVLEDHRDFLKTGGYICDGARTVIHATAFQDYLEKYFNFRKAYCVLHIRYRGIFGLIVKILYPFRESFSKSKNYKIKQLFSVLKMEEAKRNE